MRQTSSDDVDKYAPNIFSGIQCFVCHFAKFKFLCVTSLLYSVLPRDTCARNHVRHIKQTSRLNATCCKTLLENMDIKQVVPMSIVRIHSISSQEDSTKWLSCPLSRQLQKQQKQHDNNTNIFDHS
ncbi:unnamed protein product [Polarella glacialis]|uniref:Uncharacterized protein n=1 Tax=Polarella glacialis TaxID=89957 RepID=A0A813JXJ5_POLGL|nr:unnamed protein product [Polarella glacialis]